MTQPLCCDKRHISIMFSFFFFHSVFITSCETEEKKCDSFHQTTFSRTRVTTYTFYRCLSTYVVSMFQKLLQLFILVCVCFFLLFHSFSHSLSLFILIGPKGTHLIVIFKSIRVWLLNEYLRETKLNNIAGKEYGMKWKTRERTYSFISANWLPLS